MAAAHRVGSLQPMAAPHLMIAAGAAAHGNVELPIDRLAGNLDLVLLIDMGLHQTAAAARAFFRQRGWMDLINVRRGLAKGVGAVVRAGLASGLLNTSQQVGGAIGIAIASSIAAGHTRALLHAGHTMPSALTGGYQHALWVLGAIGLIAVPAIFALVRRDELTDPVDKTAVREPQPALAGAD